MILKSPALGQSYDRTYPNQFLDELGAAVEAEVERRYGLLPDSPATVRRACDDFAAGKLARALESVRALAPREPAAAHALAAFERQIDRRIGQADFLVARGRFGDAEAVVAPLVDELGLAGDRAQKLAAMRSSLSEASKPEREADRALAKVEKTLFEEGATARTSAALRTLAKQHEGTRRGAEAERLAVLLASASSK